MNIKITLNRKDVEKIITDHILKEVPIHTAGKRIYVDYPSYGYGDWKVNIEDPVEAES